ncbi:cell division protein [Thermococcus sp. P6]|uniref:LAGLIDADG family homing endonuclease n=1 Tax=Thermococcus sp. P6 TaxID=122420 RepID=UPI000B59B7C0|nr:LAGLIDADG family homing endonuclease [Thermococcus sp. P6]ASJ09889.1 cell division protein [Thermococcus sp. P6]
MEREEMIERFARFLREYVSDDGDEVYLNRLRDLLTLTPKRSLTIDWTHLNSFDPELAGELLKNPEESILAAEDAIQIILREPPLLREEEFKVHARFYNLPRTLLVKELGSEHINRFVQVEGIITRVSEVKPFVERAVFVCRDCGNEMVRLQRPYENIVRPTKCDSCGSRNIILDVEKSGFLNFQSFRLQDRPESLKGGQMPRFVDAILLDDLVDTALPGDRVLVTGILRVILEQKDKRPIFRKVLEVNHIEQISKEIEELEISPEDEQKIRELSRRKDIVDAIVDSIAPAIWGHKTVKKGIALALFGGVQRVLPDGTRLRGESHVLLVGDPGVAKCVDHDTRVLLADGSLRKIGEIVEEAVERARRRGNLGKVDDGFYAPLDLELYALDARTLKVRKVRADLAWKRTAPERMYLIRTLSGREIRVTPTHPFFTLEGGSFKTRKARELKVGDFIAVPGTLPVEGKSGRYSSTPSAPLKGEELPPELFVAGREELREFLRGYFEERGSLREGSIVVEDGVETLKGIMHLLLRFGVKSRIREIKTGGKTSYRLSISGEDAILFMERIGFRRLSRAEVLERLPPAPGNELEDLIPGVEELLEKVGVKGKAPGKRELKRIVERLGEKKTPELGFLKLLAESDIFWDRVVEKEEYEPERPWVYDLQIPEHHNFIANDVFVHNSQILRYVANLAPRAIYTSGKSSSAAGLTAAAVRDEFTGSWVLEAGVLVLADGGFALIDEFDKMSERDRSAIHEALEQQTISISKAGITATLNARTTVIAAANPKYGRFNRHKSLPEQLELPPTLLSRFDLIFLLLDEPDEKVDSSIAEHILRVRRGESEVVTPKIPYDLLKKYIAYARKNIHPVMSREAMEELKRYYVRMRKGFRTSGDEEGVQPIPITARQLEALIRLSEAHARMRLSETVEREDARAAIGIIEEMIGKIAVDEEGTLDVSILEVGKSSRKINRIERIIDIIKKLESEGEFGAPEDEVIEAAKQAGIGSESEIKKLLSDLRRDARIYEPRAGFYRVL